jgi:hypothetical protein
MAGAYGRISFVHRNCQVAIALIATDTMKSEISITEGNREGPNIRRRSRSGQRVEDNAFHPLQVRMLNTRASHIRRHRKNPLTVRARRLRAQFAPPVTPEFLSRCSLHARVQGSYRTAGSCAANGLAKADPRLSHLKYLFFCLTQFGGISYKLRLSGR